MYEYDISTVGAVHMIVDTMKPHGKNGHGWPNNESKQRLQGGSFKWRLLRARSNAREKISESQGSKEDLGTQNDIFMRLIAGSAIGM